VCRGIPLLQKKKPVEVWRSFKNNRKGISERKLPRWTNRILQIHLKEEKGRSNPLDLDGKKRGKAQ